MEREQNLFMARRIVEIRNFLFQLLGEEKFYANVSNYKKVVCDLMEEQSIDNPLEAVVVLIGSTQKLAEEGEIEDPDVYIHWFIAAAYEIIIEKGMHDLIKEIINGLKN